VSKENVELVRRAFEVWQRGDDAAALEFYAEDVEVDARHFPEGRVYHGREGVSEFVRGYVGTFEDYRLEVEEIVDAGDDVLVLTRESGRSRGVGVPIDGRFALVLTVADGLIVRWRGFVDRDEALRSVGQAPPP
jgi:uncharacterized protein